MKTKNLIFIFFAAVSVAILVGCSGGSTQAGVADQAQAITHKSSSTQNVISPEQQQKVKSLGVMGGKGKAIGKL